MSEIDQRQFRDVLGQFPTGVTVVTGCDGDRPVGLTIGSFTSVSLNPPLVAFLPTRDSSTWRATNTDIPGICSALGDVGVDRLERVRILGAGATARSAVAAVVDMGATNIVVHARRPEAADEVIRLARDLGCSSDGTDLGVQWGDEDLLISTLPADAGAAWAAALDADRIGSTALLDASYHPWPTPLAQAWARHAPAAPVASGRDMLLWQAVDQVRLMTGAVTEANLASVVQVMRNALSTEGSSP